MTRYATISGNTVTERFVGSTFTDDQGYQHPGNWATLYEPERRAQFGLLPIVEGEQPSNGWIVTASSFTIANGSPTEVFTYGPPAVPSQISLLQAKVILSRNGLYDAINDFVATANTETKIFWNSASDFHRDHPLLLEISSLLNLTESQVDNLFIAGALVT